jgi:predicted NBD/HSP70 family sugar kinase
MSSRTVILVNGVPASGKSTLARMISSERGFPLLTLDRVKEPFFEHLGTGDREYNRKLGRASYRAIFDLIGDFPPGIPSVVDAWFGFQPIEVLRGHLERNNIGRVIQLWCGSSPDSVTARYAARLSSRSEGHPGADYLPELAALAERARPFPDFPTLSLDTDRPIDNAATLRWLDETLQTLA